MYVSKLVTFPFSWCKISEKKKASVGTCYLNMRNVGGRVLNYSILQLGLQEGHGVQPLETAWR